MAGRGPRVCRYGKAFPGDDAVATRNAFRQSENCQAPGNQILQRSPEPQMAKKDRDGRSDQSGTGPGNVYILLLASRAWSEFHPRPSQARTDSLERLHAGD